MSLSLGEAQETGWGPGLGLLATPPQGPCLSALGALGNLAQPPPPRGGVCLASPAGVGGVTEMQGRELWLSALEEGMGAPDQSEATSRGLGGGRLSAPLTTVLPSWVSLLSLSVTPTPSSSLFSSITLSASVSILLPLILSFPSPSGFSVSVPPSPVCLFPPHSLSQMSLLHPQSSVPAPPCFTSCFFVSFSHLQHFLQAPHP